MKNLLLSLFLLGLGWNVFAQDRPISGRVTGDDTQPIPGASVSVKGTTRGAVTNAEGRFTLTVPENATLVVSSVGYLTREFPVGNQNSLELVIPSSSAELSEVVVVGYGTQKKSQLTGAISSVSSKEIAELPITNARQALQGRAAGVDVVQSGSRPGAGVTVRIRGRRSINASNDPLYVVDGIPLAGGIDDLNPNDIQSMEVLKDASATAIYGSRGANGVVIVTTRRGTTGKTIVSYDGYYGISQVLGKIDVMNGAEFAEYKRESRRAVGRYSDSDPAADSKLFEAVELDGIANNRTTDYQSYIFRTGQIQSHQLGVQGGSEKTQFAISGNFFQDKGIIKTQDFTRYSFRVNLDHQITKRIKVGTSTFAVYSVGNGNDTFYPGGGNGFNPLGLTLRENPLGKPYDDNGNLIFLPTSDGLQSNPAAEVVPGANIAETKTIRIFNSLYGEWNIVDGLKYRLNFGPDFTNRRFGRFWGTFTNDRRGGDPRGMTDYSQGFNYTLENILTYQKQFREVHDLNITALHSIQRDNYETARINVNGIPASTQEFYSLGQASTIAGVGTGLTQWTLQSFMTRVNYSYNDRYLFTLTGRYDGSSRFGKNNKYGFFPSLALGWNMSNEAFLKGVSWLDQLKLRGSWGSIGNTAIDPYQTQTLLSRTVYAWNTIGAYGYRPNVIGNPNLRWETTTTANVGLDYSFFRGRLAGSIEVYQADTKDLLLSDQLPFTSGYGSVLRNVGKTRNQGLEITLSTINIDAANGFRWSTDLQFTKNKEQIRELFNGKVDDIGNARFIGQPITAIYDYKKVGIWQTDEQELAKKYGQNVGEVKLLDVNNDGKIDADHDRMIIGSQIPKFTAGMTNRFSFKGLDLSFFLYARVGSTITSAFHQTFNTLAGRYNNLNINYWTPNNPTNDFPRPNQNQESPIYSSTLRYFSGTFLKVRNINLGYNFTEGIAKKLGMSSLRAYIAAQQPFIFSEYRSKYKGIDNETVDSVTESQTPSARQFIFGINAKF
ncbi:SusC/RagA family TonB-linked outer membrane protein [Siphonobacter sp.]|uniref:SusC/RagA family TonB-linked outer membrane protein n=1 Tax=Siphonobacter sp. TaxID=1869184 RepID=UPI003B3A6F01